MLFALVGEEGPSGGADLLRALRLPEPVAPAVSVGEIAPRNFSFNTPHGACPACTGLGFQLKLDPDLVIPNRNLSIDQGAIVPYQRMSTSLSLVPPPPGRARRRARLPHRPAGRGVHEAAARRAAQRHAVEDRGLVHLARRPQARLRGRVGGRRPQPRAPLQGDGVRLVRSDIERYMVQVDCPDCAGRPPEAGDARGHRRRPLIIDVVRMPVVAGAAVGRAAARRRHAAQRAPAADSAGRSSRRFDSRLIFLRDVGLDYLTLDRSAGDALRRRGAAHPPRHPDRLRADGRALRAATSRRSACTRVDNERLIRTLHPAARPRQHRARRRARRGDDARADHLIDIGPGAGAHGGDVVAAGTPDEVAAAPRRRSPARYLSGRRTIPMPARRRAGNGELLVISGARENNLKQHRRRASRWARSSCVTGVSGSGKSHARQRDPLPSAPRAASSTARASAPARTTRIDRAGAPRQGHRRSTSRPSAARRAPTPPPTPASSRPSASSSPRAGGARPRLQAGPVLVQREGRPLRGVPGRRLRPTSRCSSCRTSRSPARSATGERYNREALEILFRGKNIADVLDMTVDEALEFFDALPAGPRASCRP